MSRKDYTDGYRDAQNDRESSPPQKSIWSAYNPPGRGDYKDGYADGEKDKSSDRK